MPPRKRTRGSKLRARANKLALREDPTAIVAKADKRVLELLTELGTDTTKLHEVSFWLYFPKESQAYKAAAELERQKFDVELAPSSDGQSRWLCLVSTLLIPRFATIDRFRKRFTELAARHGGEFDGWEMEVKK